MGIQCTDGFNRSYRCDQCGVETVLWTKGWCCFASISMQECRPDLIPTLCADGCNAAVVARMDAGEVEVPTVKPFGYNDYRIKGERRGY